MNGSRLVNYPTGWTVTRGNYVGDTANDIYARNQVESSVLPCIYNGFQVTVNAGLVVNVTAGTARGDDLEYTSSVNSPTLPSLVGIATTTTVTCPASTSGWIVLNVDVIGTLGGVPQTPGPTIPADYYDVTANNGSGGIVPMFVTSLTVGPQGSFPFTQVVLAQVVTGASTITSINMGATSSRSYDFSAVLAVAADPFETGFVKQSYNNVQSSVWVQMNDQSIGSAASGAGNAGAQYQALYSLLWNTIPQTWCPVSSGTRGVSAAADFAANLSMLLPATVGRALCNSGTGVLTQIFTASASILTVPTTSSLYNGTPVTVSSTGTLPTGLLAATTYYVINLSTTTISLATTPTNVNNNVPITLSSTGTGILTIIVDYSIFVSGQIVGEPAHQSLGSETASHQHTINTTNSSADASNDYQASTNTAIDPGTKATSSAGGDGAHNNMQPSTFIPVWIHI